MRESISIIQDNNVLDLYLQGYSIARVQMETGYKLNQIRARYLDFDYFQNKNAPDNGYKMRNVPRQVFQIYTSRDLPVELFPTWWYAEQYIIKNESRLRTK